MRRARLRGLVPVGATSWCLGGLVVLALGLASPAAAEPTATDVITEAPTAPRVKLDQARPATTAEGIRTVLGLLALLGLAYVAGHPRFERVERALGVSQVTAAGLPFFLLGALAHLPAVGLLTDAVLSDVRPLLELGLGWIGLLAGYAFDAKGLRQWPAGTGRLTTLLTLIPFLFVAGSVGGVLYVLHIPLTTGRLLRDAAMFGAAGCLTAPTAVALLERSGLSARAVGVVRAVASLDDVAGVVLLALFSAIFRPVAPSPSWSLPPVGWFFVTVGMGLSLGVLTYALLRLARSHGELTTLLLGAVALAAGGATVFSVSPIVICFVCGFVLANLPGPHDEVILGSLARAERPVYLGFLIVAGALWRFELWAGWLLLPMFVLSRVAGRALAARIARYRGDLAPMAPGEERAVSGAFVSAPLGALSVAMVVNVQTLYPGRAVPLMVTTVVGGALVSEVLGQLRLRSRRPSSPPLHPEPPA